MTDRRYDLNEAILATVTYFDIFEYPLTAVEVWKWLYRPSRSCSFGDVVAALAYGVRNPVIAEQDGFYFLSGHEANIQTRLHRYKLAEKKFRIALRAASWLRYIPSIKLVAVCNNVGYNNATPESDIDFFIVAQSHTLWRTRLAVTVLMNMLRLRRHGKFARDRVCLSFYVADDSLKLDSIALLPTDPYLAYWFATLGALYDRNAVYHQLLDANTWVADTLPNWYPTRYTKRRMVQATRLSNAVIVLGTAVLNAVWDGFFERAAAAVQARRVHRYFGQVVNREDKRVIISESMLKFHKTDRRAEYRALFEEKLKNLAT